MTRYEKKDVIIISVCLSCFQVVPALLQVLNDFSTPRVQTHAGAALVNFSEQCPKAILVKYLPEMVQGMQKVLSCRLEEVRVFCYYHMHNHGYAT